MLYTLVERFRSGPQPVYDRAAKQGRMLPTAFGISIAGLTRRPCRSAIS